MNKIKSEVIAEYYTEASPMLRARTICFFAALGLKKAKKRVTEVSVRNALDKPPLKDGGLSVARVILVEFKKVDSQQLQRMLARWSAWSKTDEEFEPGDEPAYFVISALDCDQERIYRLANGGFLVVNYEDDDEPFPTVVLYRDSAAFCAGYSSRIVASRIVAQLSPLSTPTEKEPAPQSPNISIDQARKIRVMDLLAKHNFEVSINQSDVEDVVDGPHQMSIAVFPSGGGSWSDSYNFTEGDSDSYFQALEKAIDQWLTENEPRTKRRKLSKDEF